MKRLDHYIEHEARNVVKEERPNAFQFLDFKLVAISLLFLTVGSLLMSQRQALGFTWHLPTLLLSIGCVFLILVRRRFDDKKLRGPRRVLSEFYKSLEQEQYDAAQSMVLGSDRDEFPRRMFPDLYREFDHKGRPTKIIPVYSTEDQADEFCFSEPSRFAAYWKIIIDPLEMMIHWRPRIRRFRVTFNADKVLVVNFVLSMTTRRKFDELLYLRPQGFQRSWESSLNFRVQKILVRTGNSWSLFNGEWQGEEEAEVAWLQTKLGSSLRR